MLPDHRDHLPSQRLKQIGMTTEVNHRLTQEIGRRMHRRDGKNQLCRHGIVLHFVGRDILKPCDGVGNSVLGVASMSHLPLSFLDDGSQHLACIGHLGAQCPSPRQKPVDNWTQESRPAAELSCGGEATHRVVDGDATPVRVAAEFGAQEDARGELSDEVEHGAVQVHCMPVCKEHISGAESFNQKAVEKRAGIVRPLFP